MKIEKPGLNTETGHGVAGAPRPAGEERPTYGEPRGPVPPRFDIRPAEDIRNDPTLQPRADLNPSRTDADAERDGFFSGMTGPEMLITTAEDPNQTPPPGPGGRMPWPPVVTRKADEAHDLSDSPKRTRTDEAGAVPGQPGMTEEDTTMKAATPRPDSTTLPASNEVIPLPSLPAGDAASGAARPDPSRAAPAADTETPNEFNRHIALDAEEDTGSDER